MTQPILIAGPTASGKSALALALAERLGGAVINADSQQVYAGWRILSARPAPEEEARAPHFLYGHVPMAEAHSAGRWLREAGAVLETCRARGLKPILCGGTGLYFRALTTGLAEIPQVPHAVRREGEERLERLGLADFAAELARLDPATHADMDRANPVRLLRAWEVVTATGKGLTAWRAASTPPLLPLDKATPIRIEPPREALNARCDARLAAMLDAGVLDEVAAVMALNLDPALPSMKAVGAPEFMAHLRGGTRLADALAAAQTATRRYAKRQMTWARGQMKGWHVLPGPDVAGALAVVHAPGF